ncbi:MAG: hypothetical protein ACE5F5_02940 [Acidimicrobiia bacterium]
MGLDLVQADGVPFHPETPPVAVVVELTTGDWLEAATETKGRWPLTMLVGVLHWSSSFV